MTQPTTFKTALVLSLMLGTAHAAERITYLTADHMVDVASGRLIDKPAIIVTGERITAVGTQGSLLAPAGAVLVARPGETLLPGLIDMHVHMTSDATKGGYNALGTSSLRAALYGAKAARVTLMAGFTSVRDVGDGNFEGIALRDAINDGDVPGPRITPSGPPLGATGGHCDNNLLPFKYHDTSPSVADGPWQLRAKVRQVAKFGAGVVKICATGGVLSKGDSVGGQQLTLEEMKAIADEAHMLGLKVAAHAHGTMGIHDAILAGIDTIEHVSLIDAEGIRLAKQHGTYLDMDIYNDDYIMAEGEKNGVLPESMAKEKMIGKLQRENFAKAFKAGAKMTFGTDAGVYPHGDNAKQFAWMVRLGMSPLQAIQAATITAAEALGQSKDVGALSVGHFADIISVSGAPLSDVTQLEHVGFVMKAGVIVKSGG